MFDRAVVRHRLRDVGVDPDDLDTVVDLAAVGVTLLAWRCGPVEDWHAAPLSRISTPDLVRVSVCITRAVRDPIQMHMPRSLVRRQAEDLGVGQDSTVLFKQIGWTIGDEGRRLPDGRRVIDLAPNTAEWGNFLRFVRLAVRRWTLLAVEHGVMPVLLLLACVAAWRARHWWGTPWWPMRVDEFLRRLDTPEHWGDPWFIEHVEEVKARLHCLDRPVLHQRLSRVPDQLPSGVIVHCLSAGLGDPSLVRRPRVSGRWYRAVSMLLEPDTPNVVVRRVAAMVAEQQVVL